MRISDWSADVCSSDLCIGYLVGEPHRGLDYMFHMMNEARIGVGLGATSLGLAGYLYSLDYAKQRPQGRAPDNKDPASKPLPIIQHADIRRLLLSQKAAVEGALALCLYAASLVDRIHRSEEHKSELQSLMRISYAVLCLKKNNKHNNH